ncbi:PREDICTED: protein Red-like [Priapulus caudatus]|uniref:Protein Red-like n=1 Tax=Priapulus caudatus TaxID=37621 RepID=A0ABM1ETJ1_PRICU|nr:PREDICTED: protein Red-like [Priapulus caudatus]XP_014675512.1 PREDICTED: protein Red-like [Priapulus caudatus]
MDEPFSNPLPPEQHLLQENDSDEYEDDLHSMTNEDFRKLMMTPRAPMPSQTQSARLHTNSDMPEHTEKREAAEARRKKKSYYAKLKKLEEEKNAELARKYRDRAKERREGDNKDYADVEQISTTANYRAVAPDIKSTSDAAERRRQTIQESKFLGGDMEHTHLVKGLDYALLQKVRSEIVLKEQEQEELMEHALMNKTKKDIDKAAAAAKAKAEQEEEEKINFKSKLGKNIYRVLFRNKAPERNELFLPRRMAYVIELDDDFADSDVPTTTIRSKADCPSVESQTTLSTNDIVIQKLTQVLSYLRSGERRKKKKEKGKADAPKGKLPGADNEIYAEAGDYISGKPGAGKNSRDKEKKSKPSYFDEANEEDADKRDKGRERVGERREKDRDRGRERPRDKDRERMHEVIDIVKDINQKFSRFEPPAMEKAEKEDPNSITKKKAKDNQIPDSYVECYPGFAEMADAMDDSDDETDYSKMDLGNKKGPIGRWDFDTQEEYSTYMSNKEAMPKAAFQFGVKMSEGRKTRRNFSEKTEKQKLDQQWQKISNIIKKRTAEEKDNPQYKRPKY